MAEDKLDYNVWCCTGNLPHDEQRLLRGLGIKDVWIEVLTMAVGRVTAEALAALLNAERGVQYPGPGCYRASIGKPVSYGIYEG